MGALSPDQLLTVLNEGSGGFVRHYVQQQKGLLDTLTDQTLRTLVDAAVGVTTQLRTYVLEWIDTGLDVAKEEKPLARSLPAAKGAHRAVVEFHHQHPIRTRIDHLGAPEQVMICDIGCYSVLRGDRELPAAPQEAAVTWAQSLFVALLLSPWKHRICVCRRCGKFLYLARSPRQSGYLRGVHCDACSSAASAVAITAQNRKDETEVLKLFAARYCSRLRCQCNPEIIKQRATLIAEKVTTSLSNHKGSFYGERRIGKRICTRKWVVTHAADLAVAQQRYEAE